MDAKFQDPFSVLPLEIAVMILRHFNFKQIVYVFVDRLMEHLNPLTPIPRAILRVSKGWERLLTSIRDLWMKIDLSGARVKVHLPSIRAYLRRSKGMLTHATLYNVSLSSATKALELISRCSNLTYLEVRIPCDGNKFYEMFKNSKKLRTLITSADVPLSPEHLRNFLADLPALERIECHGTKPSRLGGGAGPLSLPALKSVTLSSDEPYIDGHQIPPLDIPGVLEVQTAPPLRTDIPLDLRQNIDPTPNLEELRLRWDPVRRLDYRFDLTIVGLSNLRLLDLSGLYIGSWLPRPPRTLEYLRLHHCRGEFPVRWLDLSHQVPKLKTLVLSDNDWVTMSTLYEPLGIPIPPLRVLHLDGCYRIRGDDLAQKIDDPKFTELTELNISYMPGLKDTHMDRVLRHVPDLKVLNVSYTAITGCTIKAFADARVRQQEVEATAEDDGASVSSSERRPKLERMYIKGCEDVSEDAIAYGRERGIEIIT